MHDFAECSVYLHFSAHAQSSQANPASYLLTTRLLRSNMSRYTLNEYVNMQMCILWCDCGTCLENCTNYAVCFKYVSWNGALRID